MLKFDNTLVQRLLNTCISMSSTSIIDKNNHMVFKAKKKIVIEIETLAKILDLS